MSATPTHPPKKSEEHGFRGGETVVRLLEQLRQVEWKYPRFWVRRAQFVWRIWLIKFMKGDL